MAQSPRRLSINSPPRAEIPQPEDGLSDSRRIAVDNNRLLTPTKSGHSGYTTTVGELLGGVNRYLREDGVNFWDPVTSEQRQIGGVYYEAPGFNQSARQGSGSYSPSRNLVTLTPNADITTC